MSAPAVVIVLELEARPRVIVGTLDDGEAARLRDWLDAHPELLMLITRALELDDRERAA